MPSYDDSNYSINSNMKFNFQKLSKQNKVQLTMSNMNKWHKTKILVSSVENIHDFSVTKEDNETKLNLLQEALNLPVTIEEAVKEKDLDDFFVEAGDVVMAKFVDQFYRANIMDVDAGNTKATVRYFDYGNRSQVPVESILPLPNKFKEFEPFAVGCTMFGCYSVKAETLEYFRKLTAGQVLLLQVMKEDHKRNVLEVDLVRLEEDDVCYTSVRDCLVFAGQAVLETNPYSAVPSLNTRGYELPGQPRAGTRHEVHVSHVPDPRPGRRLQLHVQVSPASMDLPLLSERMAAVYNVRSSEQLWSLVGVARAGLVCAAQDRDGGWVRAEITDIVHGRMVVVRYVDFGNEELVSVHRLRRLLKDFLELPSLSVPVYLPVTTSSGLEGDAVAAELRKFLLYQEAVMTIKQVTESAKMIVDLDTLDGVNVTEFVQLFLLELKIS